MTDGAEIVLPSMRIQGLRAAGGTRLAPTYVPTMGTTTSIQYGSVVSGFLYHL